MPLFCLIVIANLNHTVILSFHQLQATNVISPFITTYKISLKCECFDRGFWKFVWLHKMIPHNQARCIYSLKHSKGYKHCLYPWYMDDYMPAWKYTTRINLLSGYHTVQFFKCNKSNATIKVTLLLLLRDNYKYDFGKGTKRLKLILKHLRYLCVKIKSERTLSRVTLKTILFYADEGW